MSSNHYIVVKRRRSLDVELCLDITLYSEEGAKAALDLAIERDKVLGIWDEDLTYQVYEPALWM